MLRLRGKILGVLAAYSGVTAYVHWVAREKDVVVPQRVFGRWENPFMEYRPQTIFEFLSVRLLELANPKPPVDVEECLRELQGGVVDGNVISHMKHRCVDANTMGFIWLGQSTSLVFTHGKTILCDPVFEDYLVHSKWGPKRLIPSPLVSGNIEVDYVVVSHDHPDHLSPETVARIDAHKWVVPLDLKPYLVKLGVPESNVVELSWWNTHILDPKLSIACVPAMHWSGRHVWDANMSLWAGFIIMDNQRSLFFHAGDTGYVDNLFTKMKEAYGSPAFAALPIGQYCPEWHQRPRHISPEECIKIKNEMEIPTIFGVHWGTFNLSTEHWLEPKTKLESLKSPGAIVPKQGVPYLIQTDDGDKVIEYKPI